MININYIYNFKEYLCKCQIWNEITLCNISHNFDFKLTIRKHLHTIKQMVQRARYPLQFVDISENQNHVNPKRDADDWVYRNATHDQFL